MREIKFRAIIPERNAKIYFTLQDLLKNKFSNREILWKWLKEGNQPDLYTGLKDKNGREIYEGDIIRVYNSVNEKIIFENGTFLRTQDNYPLNKHLLITTDQKDIEVIGNIYENKNLLKEK